MLISQALGKTGKVIKIYSDGDLRVALDIHGHTWTFNPLSVVPVSSGTNATAAAHDNANRSRDRSSMFISFYIREFISAIIKKNIACKLISEED